MWHERRQHSHGRRLPADSTCIHCHAQYASASAHPAALAADTAHAAGITCSSKKTTNSCSTAFDTCTSGAPCRNNEVDQKLREVARRAQQGLPRVRQVPVKPKNTHTVREDTFTARAAAARTHKTRCGHVKHLPCTVSTPRPLVAACMPSLAVVAHPLAPGPPTRLPGASRPSSWEAKTRSWRARRAEAAGSWRGAAASLWRAFTPRAGAPGSDSDETPSVREVTRL